MTPPIRPLSPKEQEEEKKKKRAGVFDPSRPIRGRNRNVNPRLVPEPIRGATSVAKQQQQARALIFQRQGGPTDSGPVSGFQAISAPTKEESAAELAELGEVFRKGVAVTVGFVMGIGKHILGGLASLSDAVGAGAAGPDPGFMRSPFVPDQPREGIPVPFFSKLLNRDIISREASGLPSLSFDDQDVADAAKARGLFAEGPEDRRKTREGAALALSFYTGNLVAKVAAGKISTRIAKGGAIAYFFSKVPRFSRGVQQVTTFDVPFGAAHGALREANDRLEAIRQDAFWFGAFGMGIRIFFPGKPVNLAADGVVPERVLAAQKLDRQIRAAETRLDATDAAKNIELVDLYRERGKMRFEEVNEITAGITTKGLPPSEGSEVLATVAGRPLYQAETPGSVGGVRGTIGSPNRWKNAGGLTGEAWNRLVGASQDLVIIQHQIEKDFIRVIDLTAEALDQAATKALVARPGGPVGGVRRSAKQGQYNARRSLAEALDNMFTPDQLPANTPKAVLEAMGVLRNQAETLRAVFAAQKNVAPDGWGIDGWLSHGWVGEWALVDVKTGGIRAFTKHGDAVEAAAKLYKESPALELTLEPKSWQFSTEMPTQAGLSARGAEIFFESLEAGAKLGPEDLRALVNVGRVGRQRGPGEKFFGHGMQRKGLPGYVLDPFEAMKMYIYGASRKIAFNKYEAHAETLIQAIKEQKGFSETHPEVMLMRSYVNRMLGRPGPIERRWREGMEKVTAHSPDWLEPIVGKSGLGNPRKISGAITYTMAMMKLGWSMPAVVANASQTVVNTASEIGYVPTLRALRLLGDKRQRESVLALGRAMGVDVMMPLGSDLYRGAAATSGGVMGWLNPLYLFNKTESANRLIAGLAQYQKSILTRQPADVALKEARRFILKTQFDYSIADAPTVTTGPLGSTMFQFQKFRIKETEFVWDLRHSPAKMARFGINMTVIAGIGGIMALPPLQLVDWASGKLPGKKKISERFKSRGAKAQADPQALLDPSRSITDDFILPGVERLVGFGLPGFVGVDMTHNLELLAPTDPVNVFGPFPSDIGPIIYDALGPEMLSLIIRQEGQMTNKQREMIWRKAAPVAVRRLFSAWQLARDGVVRAYHPQVGGKAPFVTPSVNGELRFDPQDPGSEAVKMALGFRSIEQSQQTQALMIGERIERAYNDRRGRLTEQIVEAFLADDQAKIERIFATAEAENLILKEAGIRAGVEQTLMSKFDRLVRGVPPELRQRILREVVTGGSVKPAFTPGPINFELPEEARDVPTTIELGPAPPGTTINP